MYLFGSSEERQFIEPCELQRVCARAFVRVAFANSRNTWYNCRGSIRERAAPRMNDSFEDTDENHYRTKPRREGEIIMTKRKALHPRSCQSCQEFDTRSSKLVL